MPLRGDLFPGDNSPRGRHAGTYDPSTSLSRRLFRLVIILVVLLILAWPFIEPFTLETESVTMTAADLPQGIGQLRIVYATDIHKGGLYTDARLGSLISHINACNADIVLLGGDYAVDSAGAIEFFRTMPRIHSRYGVYAVLGNHDRTIPEANLTTLRSAMQSAGVTPLINSGTFGYRNAFRLVAVILSVLMLIFLIFFKGCYFHYFTRSRPLSLIPNSNNRICVSCVWIKVLIGICCL